jgi:hypothetical protein
MWSTSLTVLLLVVLGGRSVINGALIAGAVYAVQLLPGIPPNVLRVIPLGIAVGVVALAQEAEGTVTLARRQTRHVLGVLRPLPTTDRFREIVTSHAR